MDNIVTYIKLAAAFIGMQVGGLFGAWDGMMYALITFMAMDYLSGVLVGLKNHKLSSAVGFKGLAKKAFILVLVILANTLDVHVIGGGAAVRGLVIAFYLANEGLSILENAGKLGVPYPPALRSVLAQLKDTSKLDKGGDK